MLFLNIKFPNSISIFAVNLRIYQLLKILINVEKIINIQNNIVIKYKLWSKLLISRYLLRIEDSNLLGLDIIKDKKGIIVDIERDSIIPFNIIRKIKKQIWFFLFLLSNKNNRYSLFDLIDFI